MNYCAKLVIAFVAIYASSARRKQRPQNVQRACA
jgi:hypothetical protein